MSESKKGVTVLVLKASNFRDEDYPNANKIEVQAEHLYVISKKTGTIAIYAPGKWVSAERHDDDDQQA